MSQNATKHGRHFGRIESTRGASFVSSRLRWKRVLQLLSILQPCEDLLHRDVNSARAVEASVGHVRNRVSVEEVQEAFGPRVCFEHRQWCSGACYTSLFLLRKRGRHSLEVGFCYGLGQLLCFQYHSSAPLSGRGRGARRVNACVCVCRARSARSPFRVQLVLASEDLCGLPLQGVQLGLEGCERLQQTGVVRVIDGDDSFGGVRFESLVCFLGVGGLRRVVMVVASRLLLPLYVVRIRCAAGLCSATRIASETRLSRGGADLRDVNVARLRKMLCA